MAESEKRPSEQTRRETDKQKSEKKPCLYTNLPTEGREKIVASFLEENPVIDRTADVYGFIKKLSLLKKGECNVIALDGKWGCGKSTFVGHVILLRTFMFADEAKRWGVYSEDQDLPDLDKWKKLRERCENICRKCKEQGDSEDGKISLSLNARYFYYDAWKNDAFDGEPILSIIYSLFPESVKKTIGDQIKDFFTKGDEIFENKDIWKHIPGIGGIIDSLNAIRKLVCLGIEARGDRTRQEFVDAERYVCLHEKIRELIADFLEEQGKERFIIFIDELDRCNPLFAVRVLERVKHFFDNDKLVFVFSVNLEQLQHTIKKVYGHDFDAIHYVHRFFTEQDELPIVDMSLFIENQLFGKKKKTEKSKDEQKGAENE